jgi:hypothetical protein
VSSFTGERDSLSSNRVSVLANSSAPPFTLRAYSSRAEGLSLNLNRAQLGWVARQERTLIERDMASSVRSSFSRSG